MTTETASVQLIRQYLHALAHADWELVRGTLAPDVVRLGPYGDDYDDRDQYVAFLERTFAWLHNYEMEIARVWGSDTQVCAELAETATIDGSRLRTDEAIVFDVLDLQIARVQIFLRQPVEIEVAP